VCWSKKRVKEQKTCQGAKDVSRSKRRVSPWTQGASVLGLKTRQSLDSRRVSPWTQDASVLGRLDEKRARPHQVEDCCAVRTGCGFRDDALVGGAPLGNLGIQYIQTEHKANQNSTYREPIYKNKRKILKKKGQNPTDDAPEWP
jgi:hypothetical protein